MVASTLPTVEHSTTVIGVIEQDVIDRYTNGWCARLALAIEKLTNWPIHVVYEEVPASLEGRYRTDWFHAFVQTPDGRFLDIEALWDGQDLLARWDNSFDKNSIDGGICPLPLDERVHVEGDPTDPETDRWARRLVDAVAPIEPCDTSCRCADAARPG